MMTSFYASVDQRLLGKVTRFFDSTIGDILAELLQNARRAGASNVDVREIDGEIIIRDDGHGIEDPETLMVLGESCWNPVIRDTEDPAGMGIFALSARAATIRSRARGASQGWVITLRPENFTGKQPIRVEACDMDLGTEVSFPCREGEQTKDALQRAALHYPLPVALNGTSLERKSFLDRAVHVESWRGLRIGVFKTNPFFGKKNINFHGLTLEARLPSISYVMSARMFTARIDVESCPDLKLVLPARKEVVSDSFFSELALEVKRVMYRAIARQPSHALPHRSWLEAKKLGVELPDAEPVLRTYQPDSADPDHCGIVEADTPAACDGCVVEFEGEVWAQQVFARAMRRSARETPLYERCAAYRGYAWYDTLPKITGFRCLVAENGETEHVFLDDYAGERRRPDQITLEVVIRERDASTRLLSLATDLLLAGDGSRCSLDPAEVGVFLTKDAEPTVQELVDILQAAYFYPSNDADDDSYETQRERFQEDARHVTTAFLITEEEAKRERLRHVIDRELLWLLPRDCSTLIEIVDGKAEISFERIATDEQGSRAG